MKSNLLRNLAFSMMVSMLGIACMDNETTGHFLPSEPELLATFDHSSGGVIKGDMVGSKNFGQHHRFEGNGEICRVG